MNRPASVSPHRLPRPRGQDFAYAGLILFTVLLYLRPNEVLPIGTFPIVKIITIGTLVAFFVERFGQGGSISVMPKPFKYLLAVAGLAILSIVPELKLQAVGIKKVRDRFHWLIGGLKHSKRGSLVFENMYGQPGNCLLACRAFR